MVDFKSLNDVVGITALLGRRWKWIWRPI